MKTRPYTEAHAIARLEFAVIYDDAFEQHFIDGARVQLAQLLPGFVQTSKASSSDLGPILAFEMNAEDGESTEEVHLHEKYIHVVWTDYRGWTFSRDWSASKLSAFIKFGQEKGLEPASIGLAYRDVFFNDDPDSYSVSDVLNPASRLVPPALFSAGQKWRNWTSWPELADEDLSVTNTLGVDAKLMTIEDNGAQTFTHVTEVVHLQQMRIAEQATNASWGKERLISAWEIAHSRNIALMRDLFSETMLKKIGLEENL